MPLEAILQAALQIRSVFSPNLQLDTQGRTTMNAANRRDIHLMRRHRSNELFVPAAPHVDVPGVPRAMQFLHRLLSRPAVRILGRSPA
jgi:hypothetical protein